MSWLDFFRRKPQGLTPSHTGEVKANITWDTKTLTKQILEWISSRSHKGKAEAWIEAGNDFNPPSILLVAGDGESKRWRIPEVVWAGDFCRRHKIRFFRGGIDPYPQRMRDYKARERAILRKLEHGKTVDE